MVVLIRFVVVIAFAVSLFFVSPRQAQRKSLRALKGEVKDVRKIENVQREENV
jgi:hypothetical protein